MIERCFRCKYYYRDDEDGNNGMYYSAYCHRETCIDEEIEVDDDEIEIYDENIEEAER